MIDLKKKTHEELMLEVAREFPELRGVREEFKERSRLLAEVYRRLTNWDQLEEWLEKRKVGVKEGVAGEPYVEGMFDTYAEVLERMDALEAAAEIAAHIKEVPVDED